MTTSNSIILREICDYVHSVLGVDILSDTQTRKREYTDARFLYMVLAVRNIERCDYTEVAEFVGKKRCMVYHALKCYDSFLYRKMSGYVESFSVSSPDIKMIVNKLCDLDPDDVRYVGSIVSDLYNLKLD